MDRVRIDPESRKDFYLYVDEFQNFVTDSFADILSEARKYRLNLIFAHQYIGQLLTEANTKVRDSVFGNVGTLVTFRVGAADAEFLEKEFEPKFYSKDLVNLENYNVYLRLMIEGVTSRPFSAMTLPPRKIKDVEKVNRNKIIKASRERYGKSRKEVEDKINKWGNEGEDVENGNNNNNVNNLQTPDPSLSDPEAVHADKCWACNKDVKLKFFPDGQRPIYCKDCLGRSRAEKSKTGKDIMLPFKPKKNTKPKKQFKPKIVKSNPELEMLGIGIDTGALGETVKSLPKKTTNFKKKSNIEKTKPSFTQKKKKVDLVGVKKAIEDAMKKE